MDEDYFDWLFKIVAGYFMVIGGLFVVAVIGLMYLAYYIVMHTNWS